MWCKLITSLYSYDSGCSNPLTVLALHRVLRFIFCVFKSIYSLKDKLLHYAVYLIICVFFFFYVWLYTCVSVSDDNVISMRIISTNSVYLSITHPTHQWIHQFSHELMVVCFMYLLILRKDSVDLTTSQVGESHFRIVYHLERWLAWVWHVGTVVQ